MAKKVIRQKHYSRVDPDTQDRGTPAGKVPYPDLGTDIVPKERYTTRDFMQREWDHIWTKVWLFGCREEQIPEPGDFYCTNIGRESVLLVRQKDGGIRAFYNVCMHRGNRLADEGLGQTDRFVCGYHGWEYTLDGAFADIPDLESFPQGRPPCSGLVEIPCDTWVSFVWFSLNKDVEPLMDYMADIVGHLEPYHFERMSMSRWVTAEWDCNWKTSVDAFNESYHVQATHPQLMWYLDDFNIQIDLYDKHNRYLIPFGTLSPRLDGAPEIPAPLKYMLSSAGIDPASYDGRVDNVREAVQEHMLNNQKTLGKDYSELSVEQLTDNYHYMIFPNVTMNIHADDLWVFVQRPHEDDPNKMYFDILIFDLLADDEERPPLPRLDDRGRSKRSLGLVLDQDANNLPSIQAGMNSAAYPGLWLSDQELRIRHFHKTISDYVGDNR